MPDSEPPALLEIRRAAEGDIPAIAALLKQAFVEFEPLYTPEAFSRTTPTANQIQARWAEGPVWAAVRDGVCVGTVAAVPRGESLYIRSMAVGPEARGRGAGQRLLEEIEVFARAGGFGRMYLSTTPFLHAAIRLYERFGFARTGAGPHELAGTPLFTMEKRLTG